MNKKIFIQLTLCFVIISIIILFFLSFLAKTTKESSNTQKTNQFLSTDKKITNIIENIEYNSTDNKGNKYIIRAKQGEVLDGNINLIQMKIVEAEMIFDNYEKIIIKSSEAIYNTIDYDTSFKENVEIKYAEHKMTSDNVDLIFKDHKIKVYNKINYTNLNTDLLADVMEIDLLTKDLKIYMVENGEKINATYSSNVDN